MIRWDAKQQSSSGHFPEAQRLALGWAVGRKKRSSRWGVLLVVVLLARASCYSLGLSLGPPSPLSQLNKPLFSLNLLFGWINSEHETCTHGADTYTCTCTEVKDRGYRCFFITAFNAFMVYLSQPRVPHEILLLMHFLITFFMDNKFFKRCMYYKHWTYTENHNNHYRCMCSLVVRAWYWLYLKIAVFTAAHNLFLLLPAVSIVSIFFMRCVVGEEYESTSARF